MKKVAVFGNTGGGKSTLARKLAEMTHIPLYPLDMIQYRAGGGKVPHEEYLKAHSELLQRHAWIIEGFGCRVVDRRPQLPALLTIASPKSQRRHMRTGLFLLSGFLFLAGSLIVGKLFSTIYPIATTAATVLFLAVWLAIAAVNMWLGVAKAGYPVSVEFPIFALIFAVPAAAAVLVRWKFL